MLQDGKIWQSVISSVRVHFYALPQIHVSRAHYGGIVSVCFPVSLHGRFDSRAAEATAVKFDGIIWSTGWLLHHRSNWSATITEKTGKSTAFIWLSMILHFKLVKQVKSEALLDSSDRLNLSNWKYHCDYFSGCDGSRKRLVGLRGCKSAYYGSSSDVTAFICYWIGLCQTSIRRLSFVAAYICKEKLWILVGLYEHVASKICRRDLQVSNFYTVNFTMTS